MNPPLRARVVGEWKQKRNVPPIFHQFKASDVGGLASVESPVRALWYLLSTEPIVIVRVNNTVLKRFPPYSVLYGQNSYFPIRYGQ